MWRLKQIACFTPPGPQQAVLSRDDLAQQAQAQSLLDAAQYQAQALIEQAQEEARQIRQQAEADAISICEDAQARFWQQAQPLFDDWQQQREAQQRRGGRTGQPPAGRGAVALSGAGAAAGSPAGAADPAAEPLRAGNPGDALLRAFSAADTGGPGSANVRRCAGGWRPTKGCRRRACGW
ncbi:hypothetical protein IE983_24960 [Enterobacter hormaechei]|uniref:Uncharacterized protein n=1 Tax=Enterobacter hormaechei TaxID=158836 RepID=A0A927DKW2_9ENTR|nr:hypothetical protein [Enterobacter hormaechei]